MQKLGFPLRFVCITSGWWSFRTKFLFLTLWRFVIRTTPMAMLGCYHCYTRVQLTTLCIVPCSVTSRHPRVEPRGSELLAAHFFCVAGSDRSASLASCLAYIRTRLMRTRAKIYIIRHVAYFDIPKLARNVLERIFVMVSLYMDLAFSVEKWSYETNSNELKM